MVVKKVLQDGTYFGEGRITNQELQTSSKQLQNEKTNRFLGGCYGCEVEQYRGQHHGTDWTPSGWFRRVAGNRLRPTGGVAGELVLQLRPAVLHRRGEAAGFRLGLLPHS
jgi:hypothetical protein